jgi:hypothetical protein
VIPGSEIYYKPKKALGFLYKYHGPQKLIDISKSGAGFIASLPISRIPDINVMVKVPGEDTIKLKGTVKWKSGGMEPGKIRMGMQFLPFGKSRIYNSPISLAKLSLLNNKFH